MSFGYYSYFTWSDILGLGTRRYSGMRVIAGKSGGVLCGH